MPISDQKAADMARATEEDADLEKLQQYIQHGWPSDRKSCHPSAIEFWNYRDELSQIEGIILKGEKIFVPKSLRDQMLIKIHEGHMGMEKSQQRAREVLFWPGMSRDIQTHISSCQICLTKAPSNPKEPLQSHPIPSRPWQHLASDLFTWNNRQFIVTVDYYSRFFEIDELLATTSTAIIRKLSAHFARHGIPELLITDNGPQFGSVEFESFTENFDFRHVTSSPGYPQSNGLAEKTVQTAKRILTKCAADGSSPLKALLAYRSTPVDGLASSAEL